MDCDIYNHVNNAVYYSWFDTIVNRYLVDAGLLDAERGEFIGLVVESQCQYARPIVFTDRITAHLRVANVGTSSVRYEIGLFTDGHDVAAAQGYFIHVYVDRELRRPIALPVNWRRSLSKVSLGMPSHSPSA
jgi:acyl-CoA thioester hydrolase